MTVWGYLFGVRADGAKRYVHRGVTAVDVITSPTNDIFSVTGDGHETLNGTGTFYIHVHERERSHGHTALVPDLLRSPHGDYPIKTEEADTTLYTFTRNLIGANIKVSVDGKPVNEKDLSALYFQEVFEKSIERRFTGFDLREKTE